MKEESYYDTLNVSNTSSIKNMFFDTLIRKQRTYNFFVDWVKVSTYFDKFKFELSLLNSLINDNNFDDTLRKLLIRYPEVIPVIPLLLAVREKTLLLTENMDDEAFNKVSFKQRKLSEFEITKFIKFFKKIGLKDFFLNLTKKSISDYYLGIEVGLDSNARKNRSGNLMEEHILNLLMEIQKKKENTIEVIDHKDYSYFNEEHNCNINEGIASKIGDFFIITDKKKKIAIETNFYGKQGSKPKSVIGDYINLQRELKKNGITFIWITDGDGWRKMKNLMNYAFNEIDFILNLTFIKKGMLEKIIFS